jgi:hypothetical protein
VRSVLVFLTILLPHSKQRLQYNTRHVPAAIIRSLSSKPPSWELFVYVRASENRLHTDSVTHAVQFNGPWPLAKAYRGLAAVFSHLPHLPHIWRYATRLQGTDCTYLEVSMLPCISSSYGPPKVIYIIAMVAPLMLSPSLHELYFLQAFVDFVFNTRVRIAILPFWITRSFL